MCASLLKNQTIVIRPIIETDLGKLQRLVQTAWRIHTRIGWHSLRKKVTGLPALLVEDAVGLRGFMVLEPHEPNIAIIIAAGLRDTWGVRPYIEVLLPKIETLAQKKALSAVVYIGYEDWLIEALQKQGFQAKEWVLMFERFGRTKPPAVHGPATLRSAHRDDLFALQILDGLAFDQLWRKPNDYFNEALALAGSFVVAELDGKLVGYEWCEINQKQGHLTRLAIHPEYQGRGIGAQLLRQAIEDALLNGVNFITLNTQETNQRSRALYTRFGFIQTNQRVPVLWKDLA